MRTTGLRLSDAIALLERHGDPHAVFQQVKGLPDPDWEAIEGDLAWLAQDGHHLVTWTDARYPALLKEIPDPPLALFVNGNPDVLATPALAMVGSRNPTATGLDNAEAFAAHLAAQGLTIVSGLAAGIDTAAHRGALTGGTTIAVLGCGADLVYPPQNKGLAAEIAAKGAVISEFPLGTNPATAHFPQRNRIISGLAVGTLVVEAAVRSGSLITARLASEQGREVFAIPGSIHNPMAKGCHSLIRQGAKLVDSAAHVLEELGPLLGMPEHRTENQSDECENDAPSLDVEYEKLLECMEDTPLTVDKLVTRSGLTPDNVSSMLLIMELHGLIHTAPGGGYAKGPKRT